MTGITAHLMNINPIKNDLTALIINLDAIMTRRTVVSYICTVIKKHLIAIKNVIIANMLNRNAIMTTIIAIMTTWRTVISGYFRCNFL